MIKSIKVPGDPEKYRDTSHLQIHMANQIMRKRVREEDYSMAVVSRNSVEMLKHLKNSGQFFMWVDMFDPHEPFDAPQRYFDIY